MTSSSMPRWRGWMATAISIHFVVILALGLFRHWGYMTSINDLGVFDQAVWGTLHGEFMLNTSILNQPINWLGFHFHPVLLLFAPLYAIAPYPEWFILAQALALSIAAWPIFLLSSRVCQSEVAGLLWAFAYLMNPFMLNAAAWDFHPVVLAVPLIALGFLAVEKADSRLLFLSCLPLLFIQEQLGLTVAGFGFLWWLHNKRWKAAILLIALGVAHSVLVLGIVMPAFSPSGSHVMLGSDGGQLSRYGWLGHSVSEVAQTLLTHPFEVIEALTLQTDGAAYLALLLLPFLGFPIAASVYLLPGLADLGANLLSATSLPRSVFSYHSVTLVPILTAAALHGVVRISRWQNKFSVIELTGLGLIASTIAGFGLGPAPPPSTSNVWAPKQFMNQPDPALPAVHSAVGDSVSVSAQGNIGAHFSRRREIYFYPNKAKEVESIVLWLDSPTTKLHPQEPGKDTSLAWHLQMRPADYLASIECLLVDRRYGVKLWKDPWLVFSVSNNSSVAVNEIRKKLEQLQKEWQVKSEEYHTSVANCRK